MLSDLFLSVNVSFCEPLDDYNWNYDNEASPTVVSMLTHIQQFFFKEISFSKHLILDDL